MPTSGYTNPANTRLPHISMARSSAGPNTTTSNRRRKCLIESILNPPIQCSIKSILNPVVPEGAGATKMLGVHEPSTSGEVVVGTRCTCVVGDYTPSSSRGDPRLVDAPSAASKAPSADALPFMVVALPDPGFMPRDARLLTNLNLALSTHATSANYERLHDALLCVDYALKRAPYTTTTTASSAVYQPLLDAWMRYKSMYLEHESRLIARRMIPEPHCYTVVRHRVLVRNVWPEWVPGMLAERGPGGKRVDMDVLVGRALANMVFPVWAERGVGGE